MDELGNRWALINIASWQEVLSHSQATTSGITSQGNDGRRRQSSHNDGGPQLESKMQCQGSKKHVFSASNKRIPPSKPKGLSKQFFVLRMFAAWWLLFSIVFFFPLSKQFWIPSTNANSTPSGMIRQWSVNANSIWQFVAHHTNPIHLLLPRKASPTAYEGHKYRG